MDLNLILHNQLIHGIMKVRYIRFPKWFTFSAINLFGCLLIDRVYKKDLETSPTTYNRLITHERIHSAQGRELLWIFFYLLYVLEWLFRLIQYRNARKEDGRKDWKAAYRNISFEREACANEAEFIYLKHRKRFAGFRYIGKF
jgi:hypothetical protein